MAKKSFQQSCVTTASISLLAEAQTVIQNPYCLGSTYPVQEQIIDLLFRKQFPFQNNQFDIVKVKTSTLNLYYGTFIMATNKLAQGIFNITDIDTRLKKGDLSLVDDIANILSRRNYSFATKYCACHNPNAFPIYDKYVAEKFAQIICNGNLVGFSGSLTKNRQNLKNYSYYVSVYDAFIIQYNLQTLNYRQVDIYLWYSCHPKSTFNKQPLILFTL